MQHFPPRCLATQLLLTRLNYLTAVSFKGEVFNYNTITRVKLAGTKMQESAACQAVAFNHQATLTQSGSAVANWVERAILQHMSNLIFIDTQFYNL